MQTSPRLSITVYQHPKVLQKRLYRVFIILIYASVFFALFLLIVVDVCRKTLTQAGFVELSEKADWDASLLGRNGKVMC